MTQLMPTYQPGDIVRIVAADARTPSGMMIRSYIGQEAKILGKHPEHDLYEIELDVPRRPAAFGGALEPPRFIVGAAMIEPDVTLGMLDAGQRLLDDEMGAGWWSVDESKNIIDREDLARKLYRAMRAARFGDNKPKPKAGKDIGWPGAVQGMDGKFY